MPKTRNPEMERFAADILNEVIERSGVSVQEIATSVGTSEMMVLRWRSPDRYESPSLTQMMKMPPAILRQWHLVMARRLNFGPQILARLLDDVGDLAMVLER